MLSLKLFPFGRETFIQILVLDGCGTARMELALKPGSGGVENGPATNFFSTQDAIVSVTLAPNRKAFFEFFTQQPGRGRVWKAGAPLDRYSTHLMALDSSDLSKRCLFSSISSDSLAVSIFVSGLGGRLLKGNEFQNDSCGGFS
jgi:hypothetical protein